MRITIRLKGRTVKDLEAHATRAFRAGDARLVRRITALVLIVRQQSVAEVADLLHLGESTLYAWLHAFLLEGCASLHYRRPPGRPAKLTPTQKGDLKALLTAGPEAAGYPTGCWTSTVIQDLIEREFGVRYNVHYLADLLYNLGFSYQKARFVSDHLDEARREHWRTIEWPAIVADARRTGALLLFADEASFAQWGSLGYTWALIGQQPVVKTTGKRKAYKVLGMLDYFSGRVFTTGQTERFTSATYCAFLLTILAQTDRPIIVIQDGARYHTGTATQAFIAEHAERLTVYQLPTYSPDYNPIEHLWRNVKRGRTHNRYFPTFEALCQAVDAGLASFQTEPEAVLQLMGTYLDELADCPLAA